MNNIMKLADAYAGLTGQFWSTTTDRAGDLEKISKERSEARAALEAAVKQQAEEIERLTLRLKMTSDTMNGYMLERNALQAKLAAMEKQEHVCTVGSHWNSGGGFDVRDFKAQPPCGTKLYREVKVAQPLTNAQVLDGCKEVGIADSIGFIEAFELGVKYSERHHNIGGQHG